jgi:hypothetical protein
MHRSVLARLVMARGPCEVRRQKAAAQSSHSPRLAQVFGWQQRGPGSRVGPNFGTAVGEPDWDKGPLLPANSGATARVSTLTALVSTSPQPPTLP